MKKYILIIFILMSINVFTDMDKPLQMTKPHHRKHYMKKFNEDDKLTENQRNKVITLRIETMRKEKLLNTRLKEIRRDMNHCMRENDEKSIEKYHHLRLESEGLRKQKTLLRENYQETYSEILKKQ